MNFLPLLSTAFFPLNNHGQGLEGLGLPKVLGISFVTMLSMVEVLIYWIHHSVLVVIASLSSSPTYHILGKPQTFLFWRCFHAALIYPITLFSSLVASLGEKKKVLLCTDNRVAVLAHVTKAHIFVVMAATFCSHSTVCVYVDVIHHLQTLEPTPCPAACTQNASL